MKPNELIKVFRFVLAEVDRIGELLKTDWKSATAQMGTAQGIPSEHVTFPERAKSYYSCSEIANQGLYQAAATIVGSDPALAGRISERTVFDAVQVELVQACLEQRLPITTELAQCIVEKAKRKAREKAVSRSYLFPVFAIRINDASEFGFGPASFWRTHKFFELHEEEWRRSIENGMGEVTNKLAADESANRIKSLYDEAKEYYSHFPCVAAVHIGGAEPSLGRVAAKALLEASLNMLRIIVPTSRGQFIGLADESPFATNRAWIERDHKPDGSSEFISWHSGRQGEPNADTDLISQFKERAPQCIFIEHLLMKQRSWYPLGPLETRLMNGLKWFGEGWKERVPLARLVKFSVALETLIMTGAREAITETLAERLAILCGANVAEREELYAEVREVYGSRSKIVHGAMAKDGPDLHRINLIAERLCVTSLLSCASLFPAFLKLGNENKRLAEFFRIAKLAGIQEAAARIGACISR